MDRSVSFYRNKGKLLTYKDTPNDMPPIVESCLSCIGVYPSVPKPRVPHSPWCCPISQLTMVGTWGCGKQTSSHQAASLVLPVRPKPCTPVKTHLYKFWKWYKNANLRIVSYQWAGVLPSSVMWSPPVGVNHGMRWAHRTKFKTQDKGAETEESVVCDCMHMCEQEGKKGVTKVQTCVLPQL